MPWLIVVGRVDAVKWIFEHKRMAFRPHVKTEELAEGNHFAIYTSRGAYGNPSRDTSQLIALGEIAGPIKPGEVTVAGESFTKSCRVVIRRRLPFRDGVVFSELVPRMEFIGGSAKRWPPAVHRTLVRISDGDYQTIVEAFKARTSELGRP